MLSKTSLSFTLKLAPTTLLNLFMMILLFIVAPFLSPAWGKENGPLENTQVVVLSIGLLLSWVAARRQPDRKARNIWLWSIPLWMLVIGRELSWGRVFFVAADGVSFIPLQQLWYGPMIKYLLAATLIVTFIGLYQNLSSGFIRNLRIPLWDICILVLSAILATVFEKHMTSFGHSYQQVLEEGAELIVYCSMVSMVIIMGLNHTNTYSEHRINLHNHVR